MVRGGENSMTFFPTARGPPYEPPSLRTFSAPPTQDFYSPQLGPINARLPQVHESSIVPFTQYPPPRPVYSPYWMDQQHPRPSIYYEF